MGSFSSLLLSLFFYGFGFLFFYFIVIKPLYSKIKAKLLMKRIFTPNIKMLNTEITDYAIAIKNNDLLPTKPLIEKLLYIKILTRDIVTLIAVLDEEKDKNKRNVVSRSLALLLYEFYQDIGNLYDKNFEKTYVKIVSEQMVSGLKALKKMTATFGSIHFEKLKLIRMNVVGHRDFDSVKQFDIINDIDSEEIIGMGKATLFAIYWFNVFHISYAANSYIKNGLPVPRPLQKFHAKDFKLWEEAVKYINSKNSSQRRG